MMKNKKAIVIGSGIGGLISACLLLKNNYKTTIFEKMGFPGGKFTSFNYEGFEVPSGAFHAFPGGRRGCLGRIMKQLEINLDFYEQKNMVVLLSNKRKLIFAPKHFTPKYFSKKSLLWSINLSDIFQLMRIYIALKKFSLDDEDVPFGQFVRRYIKNSMLINMLDKVIQFTNSVSLDEASTKEIKYSYKAQKSTSWGTIIGGCKKVIGGLVSYIEKHNGTIQLNKEVNEIIISNKKVIGIRLLNGEEYFADIIISCVGPVITEYLLGKNCPKEFKNKVKMTIPAYGISYSIISESPLLYHSSIEYPINTKKISGYIQISNIDKNLCPPGKHFLLAYQILNTDESIQQAIDMGQKELFSIFPSLKSENILNISVFRGKWPASFVKQCYGQVGSQRFPIRFKGIKNLYMISHESEGFGFAAEIIGYAAEKFSSYL